MIYDPYYHLVQVNAVLSPIYEKLAEEGAGVPDNVFFMKQKIGNACGAFALLHSVAQNADKLEIGRFCLRVYLTACEFCEFAAYRNYAASIVAAMLQLYLTLC